jgi:hypothetical protein
MRIRHHEAVVPLVAHADGAGLRLSRALMTDGSESPAVSDVSGRRLPLAALGNRSPAQKLSGPSASAVERRR